MLTLIAFAATTVVSIEILVFACDLLGMIVRPIVTAIIGNELAD